MNKERSSSPGSLFSGLALGEYRILRSLSSGPMGCVYLGERRESHERVAIKVLLGHRFNASLLRQFEREREILGVLQHSRIARLLESGVTDDDDPYFVMEFVDGEPIQAYADRMKLSTTARLGLFLQVCDAVSYAHGHLVIHRDLKGSNILVDRSGQVKLLDFGIAKYLQEGRSQHSFTDLKQAALSLESASPEQIQGGRLSTATDVYGLGALLYRLLTGLAYMEMEGVSPLALAERLVEERPLAPSRRLAQLSGEGGSQSATLANRRQLKPRRHIRELKGNLDRIVLKCLEKRPEERYQGVSPLVEDLRDHLFGAPTQARRSFAQFWKCLSGRNRIALLSTLTGLVGLSLGAISLWNWQRQLSDEARGTDQIYKIFSELLTEPSRFDEKGECNPLDLASWSENRLKDQGLHPQVRGRLYLVTSNLYLGSCHLPEAKRALEAARATFSSTTETRVLLEADLLESRLALEASDPQTAALLLDKANLKIATLDNLPQQIHELVQTVELAMLLGRFSIASENVRRLEGLGSLVERNPNSLSKYNGALGYALFLTGKAPEAEPLLEQALSQEIQALGERHQNLTRTRLRLAQVKWVLGKLEEAAFQVRLAQEQKWAAKSLSSLEANLLTGAISGEKKSYLEAFASLQAAEAFVTTSLGGTHYRMGVVLCAQGRLLADEGKFAEAEERLTRGSSLLLTSLGPNAPWARHAQAELAQVLLERGALPEAETLLLALAKKASEDPGRLSKAPPWRLYLAELRGMQNRLAEAVNLLKEQQHELELERVSDPKAVALLHLCWADALALATDYAQARMQITRALEPLRLRLPEGNGLLIYANQLNAFLEIMASELDSHAGDSARLKAALVPLESGYRDMPLAYASKRERAQERLRLGHLKLGISARAPQNAP